MNIRLGLFRLWLVASTAWVAFIGFMAIRFDARYWRSDYFDRGPWTAYQPFHHSALFDAAMAFGPPLAIGVLVAALAWAMAGFLKSAVN